MKIRSSDLSLRERRQKSHSSMWSGYAKAWGLYGSGSQKVRCIMTLTLISSPRQTNRSRRSMLQVKSNKRT